MSKSLTDEQWCILDLLMRARDKGAPLSRLELLTNKWALLTMPEAFVTWDGPHNVTITDVGSAVYRLRFGRDEPTEMADTVICLPGPEHYLN